MAGVAGVKATLSGVAGGPGIRAQISQSDLPDDASFVYGAGTKDIKADGEVTMMFTDFEFPSWVLSAHTDYSADTRIDPTKVKGLQFQVVTSGKAKDYHFCISDLQWLDASMMPVTVAPLTSASGSPSGEAGGPSTMPSGSGSSEAGGAGGGGPVGPGPAEADAGTDTSTDTATDTETDMGMGGAGGAGP
jgi:hypothetical protein